jgi:hypothetical protein
VRTGARSIDSLKMTMKAPSSMMAIAASPVPAQTMQAATATDAADGFASDCIASAPDPDVISVTPGGTMAG